MPFTLTPPPPEADTPQGVFTLTPPPPVEKVDPTEGMSGADKIWAALGAGFSALPNAAEQAGRYLQLGMQGDVTVLPRIKQLQEEARSRNEFDKPLTSTFAGALAKGAAPALVTLPIGGPVTAGLTMGVLSPSESPLETAGNVIGGGIGGKVGQVVGNKVGQGARAIWDWALGKSAPAVAIPAEAAARQAAIREVTGGEAALPQVTKSPQDWYNWQELGKSEGPAKDLFVAHGEAQDAAQKAYLTNLGKGTGATPVEAAGTIANTAKAWSSGTQKEVGALYTAARDTVGAGSEVPMQPIADELGKIVTDFGDASAIPSGVAARLKAYGLIGGEQTKSFTVADAENLRKVLGNNINWSNKPQAVQLIRLQNAVDEATGALADTAGGDAASAFAFQVARAAARDRFSQMENSIMKTAVSAKELSPTFVQTKIINGKPGEIAATRETLTSQDPAAWDQVHDTVIDHLMKKSTTAGGVFNGTAYGKAIDAIGPERLAAIFSPEEVLKLNTLKTAAEAIGSTPGRSGINWSNTGTRLLNALKSHHIMEAVGTATGAALEHGGGVVGGALGYGAGLAAKQAADMLAARRMSAILRPTVQTLAERFRPPTPPGPALFQSIGSGAGSSLANATMPLTVAALARLGGGGQ